MVTDAPVRDEKGHYLPDHPPTFFKHKPGTIFSTGRPKELKTQLRDALDIARDSMPKIFNSMIAVANGEEEAPAQVRQAAREYLIDRIYGKANQPVNLGGALRLIVVEDGNITPQDDTLEPQPEIPLLPQGITNK